MDEQSHSFLRARTILAQALGAGDPTTRALIPPIHISTTFLRDSDNGYQSGFVYGRTDNATVRQVEALLATLEGAEAALMFSSGMAASTAVFLALEKPRSCTGAFASG
jgi:cystathionine gamma-synthase